MKLYRKTTYGTFGFDSSSDVYTFKKNPTANHQFCDSISIGPLYYTWHLHGLNDVVDNDQSV